MGSSVTIKPHMGRDCNRDVGDEIWYGVDENSSCAYDIAEIFDERLELTGMPKTDFFAWTTSPSTILAVVYLALLRNKE